MKLTKRLQKILTDYHVSLRDTNTIVEHPYHKDKTELDPLTFGVFEAAVKAQDVANSTFPRDPEDEHRWRTRQWNLRLAETNKFHLLGMITPNEDICRAARNDYRYCVRLIADAGLYYQLLD